MGKSIMNRNFLYILFLIWFSMFFLSCGSCKKVNKYEEAELKIVLDKYYNSLNSKDISKNIKSFFYDEKIMINMENKTSSSSSKNEFWIDNFTLLKEEYPLFIDNVGKQISYTIYSMKFCSAIYNFRDNIYYIEIIGIYKKKKTFENIYIQKNDYKLLWHRIYFDPISCEDFVSRKYQKSDKFLKNLF